MGHAQCTGHGDMANASQVAQRLRYVTFTKLVLNEARQI
jgi:hypothetical protein